MTDEDKKIRNMFITYEADDDSADTFMIVIGSIAENFRGVIVVEYQDDSVFTDGAATLSSLHEMVTAATNLTPEQKQALDDFTQSLNEWDGSEQP